MKIWLGWFLVYPFTRALPLHLISGGPLSVGYENMGWLCVLVWVSGCGAGVGKETSFLGSTQTTTLCNLSQDL